MDRPGSHEYYLARSSGRSRWQAKDRRRHSAGGRRKQSRPKLSGAGSHTLDVVGKGWELDSGFGLTAVPLGGWSLRKFTFCIRTTHIVSFEKCLCVL